MEDAWRFVDALKLIGVAIPLTLLWPHSTSANKYETEKAAFDRCYPEGIGDIEPPGVVEGEDRQPGMKFFFLADVERCTCSPGFVEVRHVVKNLHDTNKLPFVWEGTNWSHAGLIPGDHYGPPTRWRNFEEVQAPGLIRYGTNLHLPMGARREAMVWIDGGRRGADAVESIEGMNCGALSSPDPMLEEASAEEIGQSIKGNLNTRFQDENGAIQEISIEVTSTFDNMIDYAIYIWPPGLAVAIGGFPRFWEKAIITYIDADVVVEPKFMYELVEEAGLEMIPQHLVEQRLLFMPPRSAKLGIALEADAAQNEIVPIAVMDGSLKPLATGSVEILVPEE